jgi:hypothetical protein
MPKLHGARRSLLLIGLACFLTGVLLLSPAGLAARTPAFASAPVDEGITPDAFTASLIGALVSRNDAALQAMMGSPFVWADWQGTGEEMTPPDALARLQSELLAASRSLTFVAPIVIDEWMRGSDPLTIWPPEAQPVTVLGVGGLGAAGEDEAILVVAQNADGAFYWYGLLLAAGGFADQSGDPPAAITVLPAQTAATVLPSAVQQVLVLGPVGVFAGPGSQYDQIGTAVRGQTYPVLGASADGQWWAVTCTDLPGPCWISANPTFVRPLVVAKPAPTRTIAPTPARPTATPAPAQPERISFAPGQERAVRSGPLWANTFKQYVFRAAAGQLPTLRFNSPSPAASFGIVGAADGVVYKAQGDTRRDFTFQSPRSQDYLVSILAPVNTSYTLELIIPRPAPQPTSTPTLIPPARPERISFGPGQVSAVRSGVLVGGFAKQYIFKALGGQPATILLIGAPGSDVNFALRGATDGVVYKSPGDPAREWSSTLPRTQDYLITVFASGETSYTLELTILPLGPTPTIVPPTIVPPTIVPPTIVPPTIVPPGPAERISFAPGQDSAVRSGPLAANQYKRYVFKGMAGQTATIVLSSPSPSANFTVVGVSDGIPYKSQGSSALNFTFTLPLTQDYLISIGAIVNTSYSLVLTIPPVVGPTVEPTLLPTLEPTLEPTSEPTLLPTVEPTIEIPTVEPPTPEPTLEPTVEPTATATAEPTATATVEPPTPEPTATATEAPTAEPTIELPTAEPILPDPPGED